MVEPSTDPPLAPGARSAMPAVVRRIAVLLPLLVAACLALAGCGKFFEVFVSDSATRLAYQIRDEATALRRSGETTRTFVHRPKAWPDGLTGDYRIEFIGPPEQTDGRRGLMTSRSYDGALYSGTTYHLNYVRVVPPLKVAHRKGEPTHVTLELRDGTVFVTDLK
jgi:hypothetical protein